MNTRNRRWRVNALGLLLLAVSGCVATEGGYVEGVYEPGVYEYGGWGHGYHVGPPRGAVVRRSESEHRSNPSFRPAPISRPVPSIPSRQRGR